MRASPLLRPTTAPLTTVPPMLHGALFYCDFLQLHQQSWASSSSRAVGRHLVPQSQSACYTPSIHGGSEDCGVLVSSVYLVSSSSPGGYDNGYVGTLAGSHGLLLGNEMVATQNFETTGPPTWRRCMLWRRPTSDLEVKIHVWYQKQGPKVLVTIATTTRPLMSCETRFLVSPLRTPRLTMLQMTSNQVQDRAGPTHEHGG